MIKLNDSGVIIFNISVLYLCFYLRALEYRRLVCLEYDRAIVKIHSRLPGSPSIAYPFDTVEHLTHDFLMPQNILYLVAVGLLIMRLIGPGCSDVMSATVIPVRDDGVNTLLGPDYSGIAEAISVNSFFQVY